ncbi:hypothetical protein ACFXKG_28425 [Streptomyces sp. NPDC059255]|uniref:hypothetical protein n=1 Tax=Streptomyces sp. NPDC059255 TaxID=3346793 RepID=UPI00368A5482
MTTLAATIRAARARRARSLLWAEHRGRAASARSTNSTVAAARSRLARSHRYGERRTMPWLKTYALRGEWPHRTQQAAIQRGGMAAATAWRSSAYGRPVPAPPVIAHQTAGHPQYRRAGHRTPSGPGTVPAPPPPPLAAGPRR